MKRERLLLNYPLWLIDLSTFILIQAANFMARDGRMRAMIMDEPIT